MFDQTLYPLNGEKGILIVNALRTRKVLGKSTVSSDEDIQKSYLQMDIFYYQCSNCRKTERNDGSGVWDRVSQHIEEMPPNVSHTICPVCFDHFWKDIR